MIYVFVKDGKVTQILDSGIPDAFANTEHGVWENRRSWNSFERVEKVAAEVTELTGDLWVPVDRGIYVSPRFDIARAPKIGDKVSYYFNGDSYPDGVVTKITPKLRVTTSGGHIYNRLKNSGTWRMAGGTWTLIQGHHSERNPHF